MFGGMKQKLQEMQQKMEETKARLNTITVQASSADGTIKVIANANRKITSVELDVSTSQKDNHQLQSEILIVVNDALSQAEKIAESEMQGVAQGIMPNIPGLF